MKLNLLPTYVSKGAQAKTARVVMVLLALASILACLGMIYFSGKAVTEAKARAEELKPLADEAVAISKEADLIVASSAGIMRNLDLAASMDEHNSKFTTFYRQIIPYIPSFYRVTSMSVTPIDDKSCTLNLDGVLQSYQQYADMMLAMLRIPGAMTVTRGGYVLNDRMVPNLIETDQRAEPIRPSEGRLPLDPMERLDALIARASQGTTGFTGVGNFGTPGNLTRGPMPEWSQVAVSVLLQMDAKTPPEEAINYDLRTPDPRATLSSAGGAASAPAAAAPPTSMMMGPARGSGGAARGPGVVPSGPPPGQPGGPPAAGRGGAGIQP